MLILWTVNPIKEVGTGGAVKDIPLWCRTSLTESQMNLNKLIINIIYFSSLLHIYFITIFVLFLSSYLLVFLMGYHPV